MTHTTPQRADYRHFQPITTRWHDNDIYGHVNNVTYYSFFRQRGEHLPDRARWAGYS